VRATGQLPARECLQATSLRETEATATYLLLHHLHLHEPASCTLSSLASFTTGLGRVHVEREVVSPSLAFAVDRRARGGVVGVAVGRVGVGSWGRRLGENGFCTGTGGEGAAGGDLVGSA
jgi:hypothetical protein